MGVKIKVKQVSVAMSATQTPAAETEILRIRPRTTAENIITALRQGMRKLFWLLGRQSSVVPQGIRSQIPKGLPKACLPAKYLSVLSRNNNAPEPADPGRQYRHCPTGRNMSVRLTPDRQSFSHVVCCLFKPRRQRNLISSGNCNGIEVTMQDFTMIHRRLFPLNAIVKSLNGKLESQPFQSCLYIFLVIEINPQKKQSVVLKDTPVTQARKIVIYRVQIITVNTQSRIHLLQNIAG